MVIWDAVLNLLTYKRIFKIHETCNQHHVQYQCYYRYGKLLRYRTVTYILLHKTLIFPLCIVDKKGWNHKTCCTTSLSPVLHIDQWFKSPSTGEHIQVSTVIWNDDLPIAFQDYTSDTFSCNVREDEYLVNMQHTVIPSWYQREGYIKAMATLIEKELLKFPKPQKVRTMFHDLGVLSWLKVVEGCWYWRRFPCCNTKYHTRSFFQAIHVCRISNA